MTHRPGREATPAEPLVVRVRDVGEIAAGLPHLLGFHPRESIVLLTLGGESGRRVGLTARADIPPPEHDRSLSRMLVRNISTARPEGAFVLVVSEAADETADGRLRLPHHRLVRETCRALERSRVGIADTVLVRNGRWWCYDRVPDAGTPLPGGISHLEVASVATGTVVAGDRDQLVARIAPPPDHDGRAMAGVCARIGVQLSADLLENGTDPAAVSWAAVMSGFARCRPGARQERLADEDVARIVWGLRDGEVRDLALELALGDEPAAAEQLWTECTRRAPTPLDAAPATLLAVSAWLRGDGAMANIALDRALTSAPGYGLAGLLREALAACVTPTDLRAWLTDAGTRAG
ncbi:MAG TPA: DUF4192 domain-containing protein [Blastococcus sp.]|nr:DUF4192 domain-containing protein [Blastococcus sp.]